MATLAIADTWPVADGASSVDIPGLYPLPYQVKATPNWLTDVNVVWKTALGYTLEFNISPGPDAFIDVVVVNE